MKEEETQSNLSKVLDVFKFHLNKKYTYSKPNATIQCSIISNHIIIPSQSKLRLLITPVLNFNIFRLSPVS